eukprot:6203644-Pleurochrysis_carterae.AAC.1
MKEGKRGRGSAEGERAREGEKARGQEHHKAKRLAGQRAEDKTARQQNVSKRTRALALAPKIK